MLLYLSYTHIHTTAHIQADGLCISDTPRHTHTQTHTHTHIHTLSLSLSVMPIHTHCLTQTQTHTHTHRRFELMRLPALRLLSRAGTPEKRTGMFYHCTW